MGTYLATLAPLFGIVGVAIGAFLNEFLRHRNRRELYAPKIFEKRLAAYEELVEKINEGSHVASEVISRDDLSAEQRHDLISVVVHSVGEFVEKNQLYLDEDLTVHCMALFMGVEEIHDAAENEKEDLLNHYYEMRKEALRMVAEDSGVAEINRLFKSINKPRIDGSLIQYYRNLKSAYKGK